MRTNRFVRAIGWTLVIGSFPVWLCLFVAPFLPIPPARRVLVAAGFAAAGEIMFWIGGAILGASVVARFRKPKVRTGKSFADKTVGVIGATGGLGSAILGALEREGAQVVAIGRDAERLAALASLHASARTAVADVASLASLKAAAVQIGDVDAVILATGFDVRKPLADHTPEDISLLLATNLAGALFATQAFAGNVRDGGSIVVLGGFGDGRLGLPYYSVDVASRAGVSAFAQSMNREFSLEGRDLRITYACPAPADTETERPFAELWRKMGTPVVSTDKVADFVLVAVLQRRGVTIMGWQNALISRANGLAPWLADALGLGRAGQLLRKAFGTAERPNHD
jgi:NADP-dependent 3-hydroxy acid dehydrogenase YdfG